MMLDAETDAATIDALIEKLGDDARRLLWVMTRADEPLTEALIAGIWSGESVQDELLRKLASVPSHELETLQVPAEVRARLERWKKRESPDLSLVQPWLAELQKAELVVRDTQHAEGSYRCKALVVQRISAWMQKHPEHNDRTEEAIWTGLGERYGAAFHVLLGSGKPTARSLAAEAGQRGIRYLVRARAFHALPPFATTLIGGIRDRTTLTKVLEDLQVAIAQVPAGEVQRYVRICLADALTQAGFAVEALPFYQHAVTEAEAAQDWADVDTICQRWAKALGDAAQLPQARDAYIRSADAKRKLGSPKIDVILSEVEAFHLDIEQGKVDDALVAVDERLEELRGFWVQTQRREHVSDAPNRQELGFALFRSLDVARHARFGLKQWDKALLLTEEMERVARQLGIPIDEQAKTRFLQFEPLWELGKFADAKQILENCLHVFRNAKDAENEGRVLSSLAQVSDKLGELAQAIALEREALAARERLPAAGDRATSHNNLSCYLHRAGDIDEGKDHCLAALVYLIISRLDFGICFWTLVARAAHAAAHGQEYTLPSLSNLLVKPAFAALRAFVDERDLSAEALQPAIDELLEQVYARATTTGD